MGRDEVTAGPISNTSHETGNLSSEFAHFHLNHTDSSFFNGTGNWTEHTMFENDSSVGLSSSVTIAIAVGSTAFVLTIIIIVTFYLVRKKLKSRNAKAWEDNLTLSYIADSNIDLTKDNNDEMVSLDNDSFLNSLDTHSFSVFSPDSNTRQYTYSYF